MGYQALSFALLFCLDFILYYYMTRLLPMRSLWLFYGGSLVMFVIDFFLRDMEQLSLLHTFAWAFCYYLYPLICSKGPLLRRVANLLLISFVTVLTELLGSIFYSTITGGASHPEVIDATTVVPFTLTYVVIISAAVFMLQATVSLVERLDGDPMFRLSLPVLAFMAIPFILHPFVYMWIYLPLHTRSLAAVYFQAVDTLLCLVVTMGLLRISREDGEARRVLVQHRAAKQQLVALKQQVSESARYNEAMKRLRHDLANQITTVQELAREGLLDEADAHLAALQRQAECAGGTWGDGDAGDGWGSGDGGGAWGAGDAGDSGNDGGAWRAGDAGGRA